MIIYFPPEIFVTAIGEMLSGFGQDMSVHVAQFLYFQYFRSLEENCTVEVI